MCDNLRPLLHDGYLKKNVHAGFEKYGWACVVLICPNYYYENIWYVSIIIIINLT